MRKTSWMILLTILTVLAVLCLVGWFLASIGDLHERISKFSPALAAGVIGLALVAASAAALMAAHMFWRLGRTPEPPAQAPEDIVRAAEVQAEKAEQVLALVRDEAFREA